MAGNLLMSVSQDERERAVFRSRRMYQTDMQSDFATAEDRGLKRGLEQGLQQGLQQGISEGVLQVARNLLLIGLPLGQISTATGLTQKELESLRTKT